MNSKSHAWIDRDLVERHTLFLITASVLKLFWQANGRKATDTDELFTWVNESELIIGAIDPFAVLTDEEIDEVLKLKVVPHTNGGTP